MHVDEYRFGKIVIDGRLYDSDLMVCGDDIYPNWWRKEGHNLCLEDLQWLLERKPEILVIGKGNVGCMAVPEEVLNDLKQQHVEVHTANTGPAVEIYNRVVEERTEKIGATFHLTC